MWEEFGSFGNAFTASRGDVTPVASVVLGGRSEVPRVRTFAVPRALVAWGFIDQDLATRWGQGCSVVVKRTEDVVVRRDGGVKA